MKIAVLGAGGWGTALANLLCQEDNTVTLWGHNGAHLEEVRQSRSNERYLPGVKLSTGLQLESNLSLAVLKCHCLVLAVPSKFFREITGRIGVFNGLAVSV